MQINRWNVAKIAERIAMNEFEARGYRATDLNKDGISANADLLVVRHGRAWQVQVKGSVNKPRIRWWVGYGRCDQEMIQGRRPVFNRHDAKHKFYRATHVVLVAVRSPIEYKCIIMPIKVAERIAQFNLDRYHRRPRRDGGARKPSPLYVELEAPRRKKVSAREIEMRKERKKIIEWENKWRLK